MFPNFLRVTPLFANILPVRINESSTIFVKKVFTSDILKLNVLSEALGFSYEVVFAPDGENEVELLPNGSFTGAYGLLQRRETDLLFGPVTMQELFNDDFLLSFPHSITDITFVTRKPEPVPDPAVFLHPFSIQVWLAIIACVCFVPITFHFLLRNKNSALNLLTSTLGPLVGQGMEQVPKRIGEYLMLGTWILGSSLLYYFYAGVLLSFVTFPSLHGVRSIDDLADGIKSGKYQCAMHPLANFDEYFSEINVTSFQVIGKDLQESEEKRTADFIEFLEFSKDGNKPAFVGVKAEFLPYKELYFITEESFFLVGEVFAMHKEFCCAPDVDKAIHRIWASGIFQKFQASTDHFTFRYRLQTYGKYWHNPPSDVQLTMTMLKGPFIFLIFALSLAFLVFLMEVCIANLKHKKI